MASKENFEKTLVRDVNTLQNECDYEIARLQRLRNEIKDIESQKKSFELAMQKFDSEKDDFYRDVIIQKAALADLNSKNEKKVSSCQKYLREASDSLKAGQAALKTAEARETVAMDISKVNQALLQKVKALESKNEKALQTLIDQQNRSAALISEAKAIQKNNAIDKANNNHNLMQLKKLQEELATKNKENAEQITSAKLLDLKAQATLNEARDIAKASQLSVDRQWNEIEIQKKNLKIMELRVKKLASDKGITDELKKLEGK